MWATGTAAPCTSLFKPVWLGDGMLRGWARLSGMFDAGTLWWRRDASTGHRDFGAGWPFSSGMPGEGSSGSRTTSSRGGGRAAFTERAFAEAERKTAEWLERIENLPVKIKPGPIYRSFWSKRNKEARFEYKWAIFFALLGAWADPLKR